MNEISDTEECKKSAWLSRVDDATLICDLCIPGTHDSLSHDPVLPGRVSSYVFKHIATRMAKTQDYTVKEQLEMGVRFLDLRFKMIQSELMGYHGVTCLNITLSQSMNDIIAFLDDHPSEFVLIRLKSEEIPQHTLFGQTVLHTLQGWKEYLWCGSVIPTVGSIRGKAVIMRDGFEGEIGICYRSHIVAQDMYRFQSFELKRDLFSRFIAISNSPKPEHRRKLHINFLSAAGTFKEMLFHKNTPKAISDYMLKELPSIVLQHRPTRGIIVVDFVDRNICHLIAHGGEQ